MIAVPHPHAHARRDEEKGATAVEYGLMVALIAVAIIGTVVRPRRQAQHGLFSSIVTAAL